MKYLFTFVLIFAVSSMPLVAKAESPDLLIPVTASEAAKIEAESEYFLKKHRYLAKRSRIVRLDGRLLETADSLVIPLFGDDSLTVATTRSEPSGKGSTIRWSGTVTDPAASVNDLMIQGLRREQAESAHQSLFGIDIVAVRYEYDESTGRSTRLTESQGLRPLGGDTDRFKTTVFYEVDADFLAAKLGTEFRLMAVETSPKYHILIEVDEDKRPSVGPLDDPGNPGEAYKRQQYKAFMDALGPDPRSAAYMRDKAR